MRVLGAEPYANICEVAQPRDALVDLRFGEREGEGERLGLGRVDVRVVLIAPAAVPLVDDLQQQRRCHRRPEVDDTGRVDGGGAAEKVDRLLHPPRAVERAPALEVVHEPRLADHTVLYELIVREPARVGSLGSDLAQRVVPRRRGWGE